MCVCEQRGSSSRIGKGSPPPLERNPAISSPRLTASSDLSNAPTMSRVLVLAFASASAFSPAPVMRTPQPARCAKPVAPVTAPPTMLLSPAKAVISVPVLYALMSVNEYVTHRWYQHEEFNRDHAFNRLFQRLGLWLKKRPLKLPDGRTNVVKIRGGGHVEHHAETYDDMSLKKDPKWRRTKAALSLDSDTFRGTAFSWGVTGLMTIQMLPTTLPLFALLGFTLLETFTVLLPGMLIHALVWNMLHPPMHGLPEVPISYGAPSAWLAKLRNTFYFKYIYENHQGHHVLGGQCNYNVCCPLTDHLLGTYVPAATWTKRMRAVPGPDDTERWGVPVEPAGVPQAPIISRGTATEADLTPTALANAPQ